MKRLVLVLFLIASHSILAQSTKVTNNKDGWRKIGETNIDLRNEASQIVVSGAKRYGSIKVRVTNAPVNIESIDIFFEGGEMQRVDIHQLIKSNGETSAVNVSGKKIIKRVDLRCTTIGVSSNTKPQVELYGI